MPKERTDPVTDQDGDERHPAFGLISVHRIQAMPGEVLFQSDVRHQEYVRVEVSEATRKRDLSHDWVYPGKKLLEVSMSMTQFASFVASGGTSGVPATIDFVGTGSYGAGQRPGLSPESRLAQTTEEVRAAAAQAYGGIAEAFKAYEQALALQGAGSAAARKAALRGLQSSITNAVPNVTYAAERLDEHAEAVVEKSRADIEAMVTRMAERTGISMAEVQDVQQIEVGTPHDWKGYAGPGYPDAGSEFGVDSPQDAV
jgi:hypothetical protein